ncbi:MAG: single-stranded-DNA-specific exonuclease RecJ [Gammaproteobacteria bacterium]|nr:MAG: single-stranded-DNA-specific exonuclease RecJ [Gammaproteobacteria bacterium]
MARIFASRGVRSPAELDYSMAGLLSRDGLSDMHGAGALLQGAVEADRRILVVGDFDADGATSSVVAVEGLKALGAREVGFMVPDRFRLGYGLSPAIVELAAERGAEVIITVDNGISSLDGVAAAKAQGMQVLVTDHHLPGPVLPDADAVLNPQQTGDEFPSKCLAGVGVIFYFLAGLRSHLRESGWFARRECPEPNLAHLLDLVALGTVADMVPLDHNNRILVTQGLKRIRSGHCRPGLKALFKVAGRNRAQATAADLAYAISPRLNAAGRLTDMTEGIHCLLAADLSAAMEIAGNLAELNRVRREVQGGMQAQAMDAVDAMQGNEGPLPQGVCLFDSRWHQGITGLVASRVRESIHRPVAAFAPGNDGEVKGSARSIDGLHIRDVLAAIATRHPGLIQRFGGHAMAAGLTLAKSGLDTFRTAFDEEVRRVLGDEPPESVIHTDGSLAAEHYSLRFARRIRAAGPWGSGFPEPLFDGRFCVVEKRQLNGGHLKLEVEPLSGGPELEAIAFNVGDTEFNYAGVRLIYRLDVNHFRGTDRLQLVVEHILADAGA